MKTVEPLSLEARNVLAGLTQNRAVYLVARDLGMSINTVTRALAGLPLQQATRVLIDLRLKELALGNSAQVETGAVA